MALAEQDIVEIEALIHRVIDQRPEVKNANVRYEMDLRERTIRIEEELKHQRELMMEGFKRMDERLELLQQDMDKRFEQVDKRFELLQQDMDKRFEQVDKRFESIQQQMDKRFEQVDKRFEQLTNRIDRFMIWSFATTISASGIVIAAIKFL